MSSTRTNIIYNFAGKLIPSLLTILITPYYLEYLSVEYYGLIGFFASVQAFLLLLDGGITPTLSREVARLYIFPEKSQTLRNLARTLETFCWGAAIICCLLSILISPLAAKYWLNSETISPDLIRNSLILMSITFIFQWTVSFYSGGLIGLQKQKGINIINVLIAFLRTSGSFVVLVYISPNIIDLLIWQLAVSIFHCFLFTSYFWISLPRSSQKPVFDGKLLSEIWRYAAGMFGTSIFVLILSQTDKVILSKMLTLENFGYYSLAQMLAATGVGIIVSSIGTTYFPQFSQLVAQNESYEVTKIYHRSSQVMSFFLIPTVCTIAFFSYQILFVWVKNNLQVTRNTWAILTLSAVAAGLNGLMHIPYYMQLANGITKIGFWQNVIAIIILIPLMIYTTTYYGAIGAASSGVLLNLGYIIFSIPVMHRYILKGEMRNWYLHDVGLPTVISVFIVAICWSIFPQNLSNFLTILFVGLAWLLTLAAVSLTLPFIRQNFLHQIRRFQNVRQF